MLKGFYKWPEKPDREKFEYEEIEKNEPAVSGEEREILIETLKADFDTKCSDSLCSVDGEEGQCDCRRLAVECEDRCGCHTQCQNREFTKGDFVENVDKIFCVSVRGIDLCTRMNIINLLPKVFG